MKPKLSGAEIGCQSLPFVLTAMGVVGESGDGEPISKKPSPTPTIVGAPPATVNVGVITTPGATSVAGPGNSAEPVGGTVGGTAVVVGSADVATAPVVETVALVADGSVASTVRSTSPAMSSEPPPQAATSSIAAPTNTTVVQHSRRRLLSAMPAPSR
jgi:hypothetical protein